METVNRSMHDKSDNVPGWVDKYATEPNKSVSTASTVQPPPPVYVWILRGVYILLLSFYPWFATAPAPLEALARRFHRLLDGIRASSD